MSKATRVALSMTVIVIAVVVFIIVKPSNNSSSTSNSSATTSPGTAPDRGAKPAIPVVQVKNAKPVGGIKDLTFNKGDAVRFKVISDTADEIHVHGYDFHKDVAPGHPVTFEFPGKIDGEFVVELEKHGEQIASLKVNP